MLAAAAIDDRSRFDAIWAWTRTYLRRPDGLFSWHWASGRVVDPQPASDADLEIARALLVAGCRRGDPGLSAAGMAVGRALLAHETTRRGGRLVLAAGPWATGDPVTVNPSYLDPGALEALAAGTGDRGFSRVADGGRWVNLRVADPLPPDWATLDGAGAPSRRPGSGFGFDAMRTVIWSAVDPAPGGQRLAAAAWPVLRRNASSALGPAGLVAAAAAARAAGDDRAMGSLLAGATRAGAGRPTYYGAAWVALGRLLLTTDRLQLCSQRSISS
jgi:endoglucanase